MTKDARPLIGVTADLSEASDKFDKPQEATFFIPQRYVSAIERAGALALILPPNPSAAAVGRMIASLDGLVITGGNFDIDPRCYGEKPMRELREVKARRTEFELEVTEQALKKDLPVLGICGGAQTINVALGGSLYQDIATQVPGAGAHEQSARKERGGHRVDIAAGSRLHSIVERQKVEVNTTHHQAVKDLGCGLEVNATAEDGVIEGIESTRHRWVLGVQWHPEVLAPRRKDQQRIFSCFVAQCARSRSRA